MKVIMDIEANGLMGQENHHMHCVVFKDIETLEMYEFIGWSDEVGYFLDKCTLVMAHNGTTFDFPFLEEICEYKFDPKTELTDTLIMSRILNPDRSPVEGVRGPHSVEAWGKRLGRWKPEIKDWSVFTPEMLHRCKEDVEIQYLMYLILCKEATVRNPTYSIFDSASYDGHNWALAFKQEHRSAQIMYQQQVNGCYFKTKEAAFYVGILSRIIDKTSEDVLKFTHPTPKKKGATVNKPFKKDGMYTKMVMDWFDTIEDDPLLLMPYENLVSGPFTRIEWHQLNLQSDKQLKEWLYKIGWVPDEWNYSKKEFDSDGNPIRTSPKITETSFATLPENIGPNLTSRSKSRHRRSQIEGWIGNTRSDHRLEGQANPQGTPTGRMKHKLIANVPKPNVDKETGHLIWYPNKQTPFFGTEMRSLFSCPEDRILVGRDASGLELRCLAHYLNDDSYTDVILNGDIHVYNQELAGLPTRNDAKTFIYAFNYGAGFEKLGSIITPTGTKEEKIEAGKDLKARFLGANPGLDKLIKGVKKASGRGWLLGLDGRKMMMRTNHGVIQKNKALNTLLQGAGALIMTNARIWNWDEIQKHRELSGVLKVLDYHDEETWECYPNQSKQLKKIMIQSVVQAGDFYKLNCPLDADAHIGKSWAEIH